jgi:hypothetical protein
MLVGSALVPHGKKTCPNCKRHGRDPARETHEFRVAQGFPDGLYYICRECEKQLYTDFRLAQRAHAREKGVAEAISRVRTTTPATLTNLVDGWMGMFGGLEGFLRENMAHYEALASARPGSPAVLTYLGQIARFAAMAQKYRPPERPESEMTDDDLVLEINVIAKELGFREAESLDVAPEIPDGHAPEHDGGPASSSA